MIDEWESTIVGIEMLVHCHSDQFLCMLRDFYSEMINSAAIPKDLMCARVIALVKNAHKSYSDPNNYRPISLVSILAKLLELVILQLYPCLKDSSFLQHGFKATESTLHAAYTVRSTIDHYAKGGNECLIVVVDSV